MSFRRQHTDSAQQNLLLLLRRQHTTRSLRLVLHPRNQESVAGRDRRYIWWLEPC